MSVIWVTINCIIFHAIFFFAVLFYSVVLMCWFILLLEQINNDDDNDILRTELQQINNWCMVSQWFSNCYIRYTDDGPLVLYDNNPGTTYSLDYNFVNRDSLRCNVTTPGNVTDALVILSLCSMSWCQPNSNDTRKRKGNPLQTQWHYGSSTY